MSDSTLFDQRQIPRMAAAEMNLPGNVKSFGMTHPGRVRQSNEDAFAVVELARAMQTHRSSVTSPRLTFSFNRSHLFLIADGVGGCPAGEVASSLSVSTIEEFVLNAQNWFPGLRAGAGRCELFGLREALCYADARLFEETAKHPDWHGMGTTLTMALIVNGKLYVAHAGDSRCYLLSGDHLLQLTQDHTMTAEMVRRGIICPENQRRHPWRNIVTNALGGFQRGVKVELHEVDLHADDVLLMCTDGLTDMVPEQRIVEHLRNSREPRQACERLIDEANERGGRDNVTAIVAQFTSDVPS